MYIAPVDEPAEYIPIEKNSFKVSNLFNTEVPILIPHCRFFAGHRAKNQNDIFERAEQDAQNIRPRRRKKRRIIRRRIRGRGVRR